MRDHRLRGLFICLAATLACVVLVFLGSLESWEKKSVDMRFRLRGERPFRSEIAIITIDEASIEKLGRWPWPRKIHASLIRRLARAGAKVVAFDSLFTEPDRDNPSSDAELARAAKETGIVVSSFFYKNGFRDLFGDSPLKPYPALAEHSMLGFVNLNPDEDGITRRSPLVALESLNKEEVAVEPSMAVAALAVYKGITVDETLTELPTPLVGEISSTANQIIINYTTSQTNEFRAPYPQYSYQEILLGKMDLKKIFAGKIVFVGATAAALYDLKATPFTSVFPGVMVHANIIDNLLSGNSMHEASLLLTLILILLFGFFMGILLPRVNSWMKLFLFIGASLAYFAFTMAAFSIRQLILPLVIPFLVLLLSYGGIIFYQVIIEEREKRKIKGSFKQYLSPKIIEVITQDPSKLKLGGEEREVSIFFLDIAGFTKMSEALKPTQLVEVMNQCLTLFSRIILKNDGLINKYIGDCIMAFWNAPMEEPNHAGKACVAALECIKALPELNRKFQDQGLPSIDCRIGINTGAVIVGNMGSVERFDYTVMGDAVNLASRLEGANKQYHTRIMISDVTFGQAKEMIEARDIDLIRVVGKKEPRKVFEVLCKKGEMPEELSLGREKYHEALRLYRQMSFNESVDAFQQVFDYLPDDYLTRIYLERARTFAINPPPPAWDGVFELKTK